MSQVRWTAMSRLSSVALFFGACSLARADGSAPRVELVRTPEGGIQPQAVVGNDGVVHLIYYKGDPKAGNIFYTQWSPATRAFSRTLQVNHKPGSALAIGTIRGAQLAIGKQSRVHVVWNGSEAAGPVQHRLAPLLYARLNDAGTAFEPERDLISYAAGLDGGSSVAADQEGNVYVMWHAPNPEAARAGAADEEGEAGRAVFIARSRDEGRTFERERPALDLAMGVCACCGMRAFADQSGVLYVLFRGAAALTNRDEVLLVSRDHANTFRVANRDPWITATCPMSSASIAPGADGALAAWETANQVRFSRVTSQTGAASRATAPSGSGERKHPALAENSRGETLLVWTEGTGWERGGAVAWQLFDRAGKPLAKAERRDGVPVWSLATAFSRPDGHFVIVY